MLGTERLPWFRGIRMMDIMIDIETLDTKPTAIITQIGAVRFDRIQGTITDEFNMQCNVCLQVDEGRTASNATISFWESHGRPQDWWETTTRHSQSLQDVLRCLSQFIAQQPLGFIWANSPAFDLIILSNGMHDAKINIPWDYWKERDVRTMMGIVVDGCKVNRKTHDALEDAIDQAQSVANAYKFLNKNLKVWKT